MADVCFVFKRDSPIRVWSLARFIFDKRPDLLKLIAKGPMLISIVVPVYNNQGTLRKTFEQIHEQFLTHIPGFSFEVIFINDGSKDQSFAELRVLQSEYAEVKVISFTRNFGQNAAMAAGNRHAKGDCVINISADLQDPIDLMPTMIARWREGVKIVTCVRKGREESIFRKIPSALFYFILRLSVPIYPKQGFDYFLIGREVLDIINPYNNRNSFMSFDILETGYSFASIPYVRRDRAVGHSGYTFLKRVKVAYDNLINASHLSIRLMSLCGALTASAGFVYAGTVAYSRFRGVITIPGYTPIVVLLLTSSGLIMVMLGIIGEYLWRALDYIKRRPDYVICEKFME